MNRHMFVFMLTLIFATHIGNLMNVGTVLYREHNLIQIWTEQEAIRLQSRMILDQLLPRKIPDGATFIGYVKLMMDKAAIIDNEDTEKYTRIMVADIIGGYMHSVLLFKIKTSYYEGYTDFNVTSWLYGMMRKIKFVLNTDGRGWKTAPGKKQLDKEENDEETESSSAAIRTTSPTPDFDSGSDDDDDDDDDVDDDAENLPQAACAMLRLGPGETGRAPTVPMPAFDDDRRPGSLALPFSAGQRLFSVADGPRRTEGLPPPPLVRYYRLAVRCVSAAPERFLRDVRRWLETSAAPLLESRGRWYPALVGASYVSRAAARASDRRQPHGRRAVQHALSTAATATVAGRYDADAADADVADADADDRATCDGGDGRLPNANAFSLIVFLSLAFVWTVLGVLRGHKAVRFVFGPLGPSLRHAVR